MGIDQGSPNGLPPSTPELTPIEVNIDSLHDFRSFLGRELDTNLRPGAQGVAFDHLMGPGFGRDIVGVPIANARERYLQALEASTANLAQYIQTAEILIEAIRQVSSQYRAADLRSEEVSHALQEKIKQITTTLPDRPLPPVWTGAS